MRQILHFKNDKIEAVLERTDNHYRAGWKPAGSPKYTYPTDIPIWNGGYLKAKERQRSWTGYRKATKEFYAICNNTQNIQFITRRPNIEIPYKTPDKK